MSYHLLGGLAGLGLGCGLWLIAWRIRARRPRLPERIAPYHRPRPAISGLLAESRYHTPFPTLEALLAPVISDAARLLERLGSSSTSIRRRLDLAGRRLSLEQFRLEQVMCAALGLCAALALVVIAGVAQGIAVVPATLLVLGAGLGAAVARDRWLTRVARVRQRKLLIELPAIAEMLALAVSAGEDPPSALQRVAQTSRGVLSAEITSALAETKAGAPFLTALESMATRTSQPAVARFLEALAVAVERGTPLADVLRAQARDARQSAQRELMELGGKKEIVMMMPVVFLILPVTVLFALFPGLALLQVGI